MTLLLNLFVRFFNFMGRLIFGVDADGHSGRAWAHWCNNNRRRDDSKGPAYRGRLSLHFPRRGRSDLSLLFEWNILSKSCHASVTREENELSFSAALPPVSLHFGIEGLSFKDSKYGCKTLSLSVHHWAFWWNLWCDRDSWSLATHPRWRYNNINFPDLFLGDVKHTKVMLSKHEVVIPMPEGAYPATVQMYMGIWKRPRWFAKRITKAEVEVPQGIPFEGKGENSWDIGEDRTYTISGPAETLEAAITMMIESVLRDRRRYSNIMTKYPAPTPVTPPPAAPQAA
jgi:hypothetical protein